MIDYFDTCNYNFNILIATFDNIESYINYRFLLVLNVDVCANTYQEIF